MIAVESGLRACEDEAANENYCNFLLNHEGCKEGNLALTSVVLLLIPLRIAAHVLWLVMLLLPAAAEHLVEKAELGLDWDGE
jgi:hypothetical protein